MGVVKNIKKEIKEEMEEKQNDRGLLDIITEKMISRKFLVWSISTVFLAIGKLGPDNWVAITLGYVGIEGFADIAVKWRAAKNDKS